MPQKDRKAKPEDYLWCEECGVAVAKSHAVNEDDIMSSTSEPLCPKCKNPLAPYKEGK